MSVKPVEWVLVVFYGKSAHRATYGRLHGQTYTKDYIQLSRKPAFIADLEAAFPALAGGIPSVPIEYSWPSGSTEGTLFKRSVDRPHLSWDTNNAPAPWKMSTHPTESSAETILGDPSHTDAAAADHEHDQLTATGFGQPFLIAAKLRDEPDKLHIRVHVAHPDEKFAWADLKNSPPEIQELAAATSPQSALAWRLFSRADEPAELYFDTSRKNDPWRENGSVSSKNPVTTASGSAAPESRSPLDLDMDALAESLPLSEDEVSDFERRVRSGSYEVPDSTATTKTRGSAQRVFADEVKKNYKWRCALTGIQTRDFLIASHIVPWSVDETIRLDPSNGICLSVLVDRAFENGFLVIEDNLTVTVDWDRVNQDLELKKQLSGYDGVKLSKPAKHPPKVDYLKRRRNL